MALDLLYEQPGTSCAANNSNANNTGAGNNSFAKSSAQSPEQVFRFDLLQCKTARSSTKKLICDVLLPFRHSCICHPYLFPYFPAKRI